MKQSWSVIEHDTMILKMYNMLRNIAVSHCFNMEGYEIYKVM